MKDIIEAIEKRVELAKQNPELPFIFKISGGYDIAASDAKDKRNAQGDISFPSCVELVFDAGDGLKAHKLLYKKNDDILKSAEMYKNAQGKFEEPKLQRIKFVSGQKLIYGDSVSNLNLIRYLSYVEKFSLDKRLEMQDVSKVVNVSNSVLSAKQITKYVGLIGEMAKSIDGFSVLLNIAKDSHLNPNYKTVDGLSKMDDGKEKIVDLLESYLTSPTHSSRFVSLLLPEKSIMDIIEKCLNNKIIGYNKDTKSFQPLSEKGFTKEIIYKTTTENEAVRAILLGHYLQTDVEWKTKLADLVD